MSDESRHATEDEITGEWPRPPRLAIDRDRHEDEGDLELADTLPMHGGAMDRLIRRAVATGDPARTHEPTEPE